MELRLLHLFFSHLQRRQFNSCSFTNFIFRNQHYLNNLKKLEIEVGGPLFIRSKQKMILTDKGILFKQRAKQIIALTEKNTR